MKKISQSRIYRSMPYFVSLVSIIFAAQFLYYTVDSSIASANTIGFILTLSLSIFVMVGLQEKYKTIINRLYEDNYFRLSRHIRSLGIVITSAMTTYLIVSWFEVTTIFSASLVCVLYAIAFPKYESEAYSGTVAGMIGAYLCNHWFVPLATAIATSIVFLLFKPYFKGVGGRGGTIPYVATTLIIRVLFRLETTNSLPIEQELILPSFLIMMIITFLTYYLHDNNYLSVVKAAMLVSLVFSILIPDHLYTLTTAMFAGTIIGMSTRDRIENYTHLFVVFLICFALFIPSFHLLDGVGGKLGFLSLLSYYGSAGIKLTIELVKPYSLRV